MNETKTKKECIEQYIECCKTGLKCIGWEYCKNRYNYVGDECE